MKPGFTLIELLVALAVLGLLAALAGPPVLAAVERGRVGRVLVDLREEKSGGGLAINWAS